MNSELVQILSPCPNCRVDAAVVELIELGEADSLVVEGRCRMCGRREEDGALLHEGQRFTDGGQVRSALRRWAAEEGEADLDLFIQSGFGGLDEAALVDALLAGRPVETSFDVIAWLFPGAGGGSAMGTRPDEAARALEAGPRGGGPVLARSPGVAADPQPDPAADVAQPQPSPAEIAVHGLIAVMLADGLIRPGERRFLDAFVSRAGLPPVDDSWIRPWRPNDVPRPADPEPILQAMVDLTFIDRERDGSEWRVVREFARAWAFPVDRLERMGQRKQEQVAPAMARLWRSLRRLLVTEGG